LQSALFKGEKILFAAELHWFLLVRPFFFLIPAVVLGTYYQILAIRETDYIEAYYKGLTAGIFYYLGGVVTAIQFLLAFMRWRFSQFCVTDQRVLIREGHIYHRTDGIALDKVGMLTVHTGNIGRRLGYGTLKFSGDRWQAKIRDIVDPIEFYDHIRDTGEQLRKTKKRKRTTQA
jgi:membrane protein YdbS with pleckstrin-like domain